MIRLFVALDLPWALRDRLTGLAGGLRGARWVPPENYHLTLRFIGEVPPWRADEVDHALASLRAPGFVLTLTGLGVFEKAGRAVALWVGAERNPGLDHLRGKIETALQRTGLAVLAMLPAEAFCMIASDAATSLDISEGNFLPTKWSDWIALPVRDCDQAVNTPRGPVRVPTVIIAVHYTRVPRRRPRFSARGIWERDGGVCQYTGRKLSPKEGNIDHVVPRSRGGKTSWDNCVLTHCEVNSRKADRLPHEAGLRLRKQPAAPRALPVSVLIRNQHRIPDWEHFLR